ncbi:2408_t:CDS:2, partial [Dentiscutata heterogama]
ASEEHSGQMDQYQWSLLASIGSIQKLFSMEQWNNVNGVVLHLSQWINVPTLIKG